MLVLDTIWEMNYFKKYETATNSIVGKIPS